MSRTPGPWEIKHRDKPRKGELDWWIFGREEDIGGVRIAEVIRADNARLIAAAPDLAEALKEAVDCYGKPGGPWNVPSDPGGWLERARAALRKAGEIPGEVGAK